MASIDIATTVEVLDALSYVHKTVISDVYNTIDEAVAKGARLDTVHAERIQRELDEIAYWAKRLTEQVKANTLS